MDLQIEKLCRIRLEADVKSAAEDVSTRSVHEIYAEIYNSTDNEGPAVRKVVKRAISWLLCSYEALTPALFLSAISSAEHGRIGDITDTASLTTICGGLVIIDTKMDVVRFVHRSLQEFLAARDEFTVSECHRVVAETCLSMCIHGPDMELATEACGKADLYKYCTLYWPRHCHCAELEGSVEALTKKMKEFVFDGDDTSLIFVEWLKQAKEFSKTLPPYHELERPEDAAFKAAGPPFFLACAFGLMSIVDHFGAQKNMDYNIRNSLGHTGIYLAGAHGHTAIVQYLLDHGAEPRPSGGSFGSPLYAAAFKGHIEVVKILLKPYAGEVYDKICDTAIEAALTGSQELIALTVLEKRSPFENKEEYDIFILRAVQAGFVHVVDHLRNNTKYERGFSTPPAKARLINSAILKGSFTVLRPLLSPAQNHAVGLQLELPRGAMSVASLDGHLDIIMLLLNHNVDLEQEGPYGRPLRVASLMGHESVVRVLLDHGADANVGGPHGDALQAAAMQGHLTITRMLLRKGAKIGRAGGIFGNALEAAAVRGHRSVAEELLKSGTFDPEYLKYEIFEESFNAAVVVGQENIIRSFSEVKMDRPWWMYDDPPFVPPRENKDLIRAASPKKGPTSNVNAFESYQKEDMKPAIARTLDAPLPASVWETSYPSIDRFQQIFLERNNEDRVEDETNSITKSEALLMDRLRKIPPLVGAALRNSKSIVSFLIQSDNKTKNDVNVEVLGNAVLTALENGNMEIVRLLLNQNFVDSEAVIRLLRELVSHGDRMVVELLLKNIDGSECPSHRYQDFALYRRRNRLKPTSPSPDRVYHFALIEVLQVSCEVGQISVIELAVDLMNKDKWFNEHQTVKYPLLRSAFETACANNQCHVLPVLSEYISDLKPSSLQCRAFQRASIRGGCESIRSLYRILSILAKYVLPPAGSYLHYRALRTAAEKGHHGTVQFLVETYSSELSLKAYEDAVLAASGNGHAETLRWLIYKVKEIRSSQSLLDTAFHLAVSNGRVEVVGILIREIADINATVRTFVDFDDDYRHHRRGYGSPYHSTARPKASSPLQAVLSSFTIRGLPLQLMFQYRCWEPASQCDKEATVRVLLDHDADIWSLGGFPRTPLQQAVQFVSLDVVRLILARVSHLDDALVHKLLCSATVRELLTGTILHELLEHFGTVRSNNMDLSQPLANALAFFDTCRDHESAKGIGRFIRSESINDVLSTGPGAAIKILLPKCPDAEVNDARYGLLLQMATVKGDIKYVKLLLERGLDPNWEGGYYHTSLQAAARMGHTDIVKLLIAAGADPNKAGGSHSTPLWAAVQYQRGEMVKLLIAHGADANPPASYWPHARTYYPSLVQMAIAMDDMSIVKSLIDRGAHINPAPSERHSHFPAIIEACHRGNPAMVRLLLTYGADPRILGPMKPHVIPHYYPAVEKTSALHMACKMGHQEVVQELLAYGVDLESSDIDFGTPLCAAAFGGHISVMEILLEAGANTDESVNGSALWYAASRGHSQIVEKLLAMGVTLGIRSSSRNALKEASFWWFRKDIIQILLDSVQGSPEEIAACEDALASACARKNDDALKLLLDYGAPPFPGLLHRACRFGLAKSVETLLDMSMASNEVDEEGNSPLQVAIADGQHHIASLLMERGVKNDEDNAKYGAPVIVVEEVVVGKEC